MKNFLLLILVTITQTALCQVGGIASGQSQSAQSRQRNFMQIQRIMGAANTLPDPANIKGSAYLNEIFLMSTISLGEKALDRELTRYNAYSDEIEIPGVDDQNLTILKFEDQKITNYEATMICRKDSEGELSYFIQHGSVDGIEILEKYNVIYDKGRKAQTSLEREIPPSFKERTSYYMFDTETRKLSEIRFKSKKALSKDVSSIRPEWKSVISDNNVKINDPSTLVALLKSK